MVYNLSGNARINHASIDRSTNLIHESGESDQVFQAIEALKKAIQGEALEPALKSESLEIVSAIEEQVLRDKPKRAAIRALLSALPKAANVATIVNTLLALFHGS